MTRPDYDYAAAEKRANACGHDCRCDFALRGDLCDFGESKAERMKDERGTAESVLVVGIALAVAGLWLASSLQPWQVVGLLVCSAYAICCWVLCRGARHGAEIRDRLDADAPKGGAR